jgi:hypothetical protein
MMHTSLPLSLNETLEITKIHPVAGKIVKMLPR